MLPALRPLALSGAAKSEPTEACIKWAVQSAQIVCKLQPQFAHKLHSHKWRSFSAKQCSPLLMMFVCVFVSLSLRLSREAVMMTTTMMMIMIIRFDVAQLTLVATLNCASIPAWPRSGRHIVLPARFYSKRCLSRHRLLSRLNPAWLQLSSTRAACNIIYGIAS